MNQQLPQRIGQDGPDVVIVGAGILGAAMGYALARDGRKVTVIERSMLPPNRIAGEVLQPGGVKALTLLNMQDCLNDTNGAILSKVKITDPATGREVYLPYQHHGITFHNDMFVTALRRKAQQEENCTFIEGTVIRLLEENGAVVGVSLRRKDKEGLEELKAPLTIAADGSFSRMRKVTLNQTVHHSGHFVGLEYPGSVGEDATLELFALRDTFVYVYHVSPNKTRFIIDIRGKTPTSLKDYLADISNQLPEKLQGFYLDALQGPVRCAPTFCLASKATWKPGILTLGDAYNMRHPITGAGMTVALKDVIHWRHLLQGINNLEDHNSLRSAEKTFVIKRKLSHSFMINVYANCLYNIFSPVTAIKKRLQSYVIDYLALGGQCSQGPADLMAILQTKPPVLLYHLLAITFYAMFKSLKEEGIVSAARIFYAACSLLIPEVLAELKELMTW